jgi:hypothetical protein
MLIRSMGLMLLAAFSYGFAYASTETIRVGAVIFLVACVPVISMAFCSVEKPKE